MYSNIILLYHRLYHNTLYILLDLLYYPEQRLIVSLSMNLRLVSLIDRSVFKVPASLMAPYPPFVVVVSTLWYSHFVCHYAEDSRFPERATQACNGRRSRRGERQRRGGTSKGGKA